VITAYEDSPVPFDHVDIDATLRCSRCGREIDESQLRDVHVVLRRASWIVYWKFSGCGLEDELSGRYCRRCRWILSVATVIAIVLVATLILGMILEGIGLVDS